MIREELLRRLEEEGVDRGAYDLDRTQRDEVCCLEPRATAWVYYYHERGIHRDECVFASEEEAAQHFLDRVLKDPTTRVRR